MSIINAILMKNLYPAKCLNFIRLLIIRCFCSNVGYPVIQLDELPAESFRVDLRSVDHSEVKSGLLGLRWSLVCNVIKVLGLSVWVMISVAGSLLGDVGGLRRGGCSVVVVLMIVVGDLMWRWWPPVISRNEALMLMKFLWDVA